MNKEEIFTYIQNYLKEPPLVIWGSGATIDFGLPSMSDLKDEIAKKEATFDSKCKDLEEELGKEKYEPILQEIRKIIRNVIYNADINAKRKLLKNESDFEGILNLTKFCFEPHPKVMNVVSTNYDMILEYVWGFYGFKFSDGFQQQELSVFDEENFGEKEIINLMKVHGSLNWFEIDNEVRKFNSDFGYLPIMIPPGKNKYRTSHNSPYRELMQKSDNAIKKANSFLVVGFGFNDEHITPLIIRKIKDGTPIVVVTKYITSTTIQQLDKARKVIYVEADETNDNKSRIRIKDNGIIISDSIEDDSYWRLKNFMKILI
jgi:hypothetical protein